MTHRTLALAALALSAGTPAILAAQQDSGVTTLPDIVVSEARLPVPAHAVTSDITVLSGDELRTRGITLLQDALREVPGLNVVQGGSFGAVSSVFARGGESDYVKVLVDGVPVNDPGGAFDFSSLTLDDVERIEIVRGPASVTYGSDAVTGVVRIVTRTGRGPARADAIVRAGTFGTWDGSATASGSAGRLGWSVGGSGLGTDGTYAFNNAFRNAGTTIKLTARPDSATDIALSGRYGWNTFHFPTDGAGVPSDSNQFSQGRNLAIGLDGGRMLTPHLELRFAGGYARSRARFTDRPDGAWDTTGFAFASDRDAHNARWNLDGRAVIRPASRVVVSVGTQFERQLVRTSASYTSNFGGGAATDSDPRFDRSRNVVAGYAEARADLTPRLIVTGGTRVDDDQAFGTFATWRVGFRYRFPVGLSVRGSAGTGFKAPTFSENFANSPFETGNPDLRPERSRSWEVGMEQTLASGRVTAGATWFDQRFRNLIQYVSGAPGEPTYQNLGAALARGIEGTVSVQPLRTVSAGVAWTWLDTRVTDAGASTSPGFADGERLIRRPAGAGRAWAEISPVPAVHLSLAVSHTGSRDDVDFGSFPSERVTLPAYTLVSASLDAELVHADGARPGVALVARAENIFDEDYQTIAGFPGIGRRLLAGVRLSW